MASTALKPQVTQAQVDLAWANYRAIILAEADDASLADSVEHYRQRAVARFEFERLYDEWCRG